jgi:hypothetical protein
VFDKHANIRLPIAGWRYSGPLRITNGSIRMEMVNK